MRNISINVVYFARILCSSQEDNIFSPRITIILIIETCYDITQQRIRMNEIIFSLLELNLQSSNKNVLQISTVLENMALFTGRRILRKEKIKISCSFLAGSLRFYCFFKTAEATIISFGSMYIYAPSLSLSAKIQVTRARLQARRDVTCNRL